MAEEKIVNRIVTTATILEVAEYLEKQKEEYDKLFEQDKEKNKDVKYSEQVHEYDGQTSKVEYTVQYKDGRELTQKGYEWLRDALSNPKGVEKVWIYSRISYYSNDKNRENRENKALDISVYFYEEYIRLRVDGTNIEEVTNKNYSYIRGVIENNEERYNKTVKRRGLRKQSFCFALGYVLAIIIYLVIMANIQAIPTELIGVLTNKYVLIIGQWFLAALLGNVFGAAIMHALYKNIVPNKKYSHYDKSSSKSVYVDNIEDYMEGDEVQIGKFANNGKNREIIEKMFKITNKVILVELLISVILFFVLK